MEPDSQTSPSYFRAERGAAQFDVSSTIESTEEPRRKNALERLRDTISRQRAKPVCPNAQCLMMNLSGARANAEESFVAGFTEQKKELDYQQSNMLTPRNSSEASVCNNWRSASIYRPPSQSQC